MSRAAAPEEIARIDQPVADLVERKAEQATRAERRQHDLRALLGAVGFRHCVSSAQAGIECGSGAKGRAGPQRVLDAKVCAQIEHQGREAGGKLAPAGEPGVALGIGVEAPHEGRERLARRKELHAPGAQRGGVLGDGGARRLLVHWGVQVHVRL